MADSGMKDAQYLSSKYIPVMQKFDPNGDWYNMVVFDGASNVQKGGEVICAKFPKCTVFMRESMWHPSLWERSFKGNASKL